MPGRRLLPEDVDQQGPYGSHAFAQRRAILRETIRAFEQAAPADRWHRLALNNLAQWRTTPDPLPADRLAHVFSADWGEVAGELTRRYGELFAVLNMANAYVPGGGYVEGCPAQEENLFRRTDCHFCITADEMDEDTERYHPELTALLNAQGGRVLLDTESPRVCIRGPERSDDEGLGYPWLDEAEVFPFYELRASAQDCRSLPFDRDEARRRIEAQLDTLIDAGVHHVVLSAFGCGAFLNPAPVIAELYREVLESRRSRFVCVGFAIYYPGYGPNNVEPFRAALDGW